jgi:hypothetical protein
MRTKGTRPSPRFYPSKVKTEIKKLVDEELANFTYDQNGASKKANDLAILIRKLLKQGTGDARMKRYKLLVQVVIGELKGQGIRIMSQCLWDEKLDNYTDCTFQKVGSSFDLRKTISAP